MSLLGWSKTLASEVAGDGVTVNVMVPGRIATDRVSQLDALKAQRENSSAEAVAERVVRAFRPGAMANRRSTAPSLRFWQASLPATLPAR